MWRDTEGATRTVEPDALLALLALFGRVQDAEEREESAASPLEPVLVAWDGAPPSVALALPADGARRGRLEARLTVFDHERPGEREERGAWSVRLDALETPRGARGPCWTLPLSLPHGWYELTLAAAGREGRAIVVSAPRVTPPLARGVGLFAPAYELHDARTRHAGGWRELARLARWAGELGLRAVATTPLTACDARDASPYAPLSRRHWDERFLDLDRVVEEERCEEAARLLRAAPPAARGPLADPQAAARLARAVLAPCARAVAGERAQRLARFRSERPDVERYARWRAAREPQESGAPADPALHAYAQWRCEEALEGVRRAAHEHGVALLLDVPLGVRGDGFDVADDPGAFLVGASAGAPPDAFFRGGQRWGFPPPHPRGARASGYRDLALALRRHARCAGALRLDHVMALHRLWVVPPGADARAGAYVRYRANEQLAVIALEAARAGCAIVGEDLGTVPPAVRGAMHEHGLHRTLVLPFSYRPAGADGAGPFELEPVPERALLSLGSHDLAPFAAWWTGRDLDEHEERGELAPQELALERAARERFRAAWRAELVRAGALAPGALADEVERVLDASLAALARTDARLLSVALDDLAGETRRQNAPGTERPENWRVRARLSLEALEASGGPAARLVALVRLRAAALPAAPAS